MKIDTASIDGFDAMTPEQKLAAIMGIEVPDPVDLSGYVKKDVFDAKAKEAAEKGRALQEKQTEEERAAAEQKAAFEKMQGELDQLRTDKSIAEHKANFSSLGYDDELSTATAKALASGDMSTVFANQKKFLEIKEKAIKADVLKGTPAPGGAGGGGDEKPANVEMAKAMGAQKAATLKAANDGLKNYL